MRRLRCILGGSDTQADTKIRGLTKLLDVGFRRQEMPRPCSSHPNRLGYKQSINFEGYILGDANEPSIRLGILHRDLFKKFSFWMN